MTDERVIASGDGPQRRARICDDAYGGFYVIWQDGDWRVRSTVHLQRLQDDGAPRWTEPRQIEGSGRATSGDVAASPWGVFVGWRDRDRRLSFLSGYDRRGRPALAPLELNQVGVRAVVPDGDRGVLVMTRGTGLLQPHLPHAGHINVTAATLDGGTEGSLGRLPVGHDLRAGGALVHEPGAGRTLVAAGELTTMRVAALTEPRFVVEAAQSFTRLRRPVAVSDGAGGAIVTWMEARTTPGQFNLYAQRVDRDGHVLWQDNGVELLRDVRSHAAVATSGGALLAVERVQLNPAQRRIGRIFSYVLGRDGVLGPERDTTVGRVTRVPRMIPDGQDGAILAWHPTYGPGGIGVQRLNPDATAGWAEAAAFGHGGAYHADHQLAVTDDRVAVLYSEGRGGYHDVYLTGLDAPGVRRPRYRTYPWGGGNFLGGGGGWLGNLGFWQRLRRFGGR